MRLFVLTLLLFSLSACQLPPESATQLLPEDKQQPQKLPFTTLLTRLRRQATAANEAFYRDEWADLEEAAKAMEQSSRFLREALEVPVRHRDVLPNYADDLAREAMQLNDAAKKKDVKKANETLQRLHLKVRELRDN
jgi:hypothetical protein